VGLKYYITRLKAWIVKEAPRITVFSFTFLFSVSTFANPQGGAVAAGDVSITTSGSTMQINQASHKAIVNWKTFNIARGEQVNIQQPSSSSIILNRANPHHGASTIHGTLTANGQVWIVNPAGIQVGQGAFVNVGGLLATTRDITDANFLNGNYRFMRSGDWNGSIINEGDIVVHGAGLAALVGSSVVNKGRIVANMGTIVLGSAQEFTVDFTGDQLINFHVGSSNQNSNERSEVINSGVLVANGGRVEMSARAAGGVLDSVINMSGVVQAKSVGVKNGVIILDGGESGTVKVTGKLIASGKKAGEKGGTVKVLGKNIALEDDARITVAGDAGGGQVLIGGNAHGAGPEPNAQNVFIGANTKINASALTSGDGGNVVVWSDNGTDFYGNIFAKGGALSGNGGFVEVSGKYNLNFDGYVDASAPFGATGTLLLDPQFLIVSNSGGSAYSSGSNNLFANNPAGASTITATSLNALAKNVNVLLQANTDIIFNSDIDFARENTLSAYAGRSILINSNITTKNSAITLYANCDNISCLGAVLPANRLTNSSLNPAGDTETVAGNIIQAAGKTIDSGSATTTLIVGSSTTAPFTPGSITLYGLQAGDVVINSPNAVTLNGAVSSTGTVAINANTDGVGSSGFTIASGGSLATTNTSSSAIAVKVNTALSGTGGITLGGNVTGKGGSTITLSTTGVTTASGGNVTGGSITQLAGSTINSSSGGTNINLFVPTSGSSSISGASGPSGNALATAAGTARTINITAGSGGASIYNTGSMTLAVSGLGINAPLSVMATGTLALPATAIATGTSALTLKSLGGALTTAGSLSTTSGLMTLESSGLLTVNNPLSTTTGGLTLTGGTGLALNSALTSTSSGAMNLTATTGNATLGASGSIAGTSGFIKLLATAGTITLNSTIANTSTVGNAIILAAQTFINNYGAAALNSGIGNYQIWSNNPSGNTLGGLVYHFKQYNATYGSSTVLGSGSGVFYTLAPILTPSLTGTVSKVYDATTVATLASNNYAVSGAVEGDTVTLNNPTTGTYDTANVGTGLNVAVSGLSIASASNSGVTVYGYQLASTSVSGNIGEITVAQNQVTPIPVHQNLLSVTNNFIAKNLITNMDTGSVQVSDHGLSGLIQNNVSADAVGFNPFLQANEQINARVAPNNNSVVAMVNSTFQSILSMSLQTRLSDISIVAASVFSASAVMTMSTKQHQQIWSQNGPPAIALIKPFESIQNILLLFAVVSMSAALRAYAIRGKSFKFNLPAISFKLRSALDTIIGFAQLIYSGSVGSITPEQKEFLGRVLAQSNTLKAEFQEIEVEAKQLYDAEALSRFSFKLRTSLNSIIGFTSLICYSNAGSISMQQKKFLEDILSSSNQLLYLLPNGRQI
jgi:filamentous hemagglutinin family protein